MVTYYNFRKNFIAWMLQISILLACSHISLAFLPPAAVIDAINAPRSAFDTRQNTNIPFVGNSVINSVVIDNDNKIVVAGFFNNGLNTDFMVARYNQDGSLDTSFNTLGLQPGVVTTDVRGFDDSANWVVIDNNNKIVVAGYSSSRFNRDITLIRYNPDGSLDQTFNPAGAISNIQGIVITSVGIGTSTTMLNDSVANCVIIDNENRIIVTGYSNTTDNTNFTLVRYNPDGSLDMAFDPINQQPSPTGQLGARRGSQLGIVITDVLNTNNIANSIVIDNNNKILVVGSIDNGITFDFMLARYNQDGTLDATFNPSGILSNIALTNLQNPNIPTQTALSTGSVRIPGIVTTDINGAADRLFDVKIDNSNKIVVVGTSTSNNLRGDTGSDFAIARYNPDGSLDTTFNPTGIRTSLPGILTVDVSGREDIARSVLIDSNNKIVVAGTSQVSVINGIIQIGISEQETLLNIINTFTAMRFNENGSFDTTFTSGQVPGMVLTIAIDPQQATSADNVGNFIALDNDNNLVLGGFSDTGFGNNVTFVRYLTNGTLDTALNPLSLFGPRPGIVITQVLTLSRADDSAFLGVEQIFVPLSPEYIRKHIELIKSVSSTMPLFSAPMITSPVANALINEPSFVITGTAQPRSFITIVVDGIEVTATQTDGTGVWSIQVPELSEGKHQIVALSRDIISNISLASAALDIVITTQAPEPPIITEPKNNSFTDTANVRIAGTATPDTTVTLFVNKRDIAQIPVNHEGTWEFTAQNTPDGKHIIYVVTTDAGGNTSSQSNQVVYIVNTKPLKKPIILAPRDNAVIQVGHVTVRGEAQPYYPLELLINNIPKTTITADSSGRWNYTFTNLMSGAYVLSAQMQDPVKKRFINAKPIKFTISVQNNNSLSSSRARAIITKLDGRNSLIQGTAEPNSSITILLDNNVLERVKADSDGRWQVSPAIAKAITPGRHTIAIAAINGKNKTNALSRLSFIKPR